MQAAVGELASGEQRSQLIPSVLCFVLPSTLYTVYSLYMYCTTYVLDTVQCTCSYARLPCLDLKCACACVALVCYVCEGEGDGEPQE